MIKFKEVFYWMRVYRFEFSKQNIKIASTTIIVFISIKKKHFDHADDKLTRSTFKFGILYEFWNMMRTIT